MSLVSSQCALGKQVCGSLCLSFLALGQVRKGLPVAQLSLPWTVQKPLSPAPLRRRVRIFCLASQLPFLRLQADPLLSWPGARPPAAKSRVGAALQGETHCAAGAPMAWSQHGGLSLERQ